MFFTKLTQIVNQIWNFMFEGGGKHNSKIEISFCFMHFISPFCSCFFGEFETNLVYNLVSLKTEFGSIVV